MLLNRPLRIAIAIAVLATVSCEDPQPSPPTQAEAEAPASPPQPQARLEATPTGDLKAGDTVEVCWTTENFQTCTLSILHASGEGNFGDVHPHGGCRPVVMEEHTLIELFCSGPGGDAHEVLNLQAD